MEPVSIWVKPVSIYIHSMPKVNRLGQNFKGISPIRANSAEGERSRRAIQIGCVIGHKGVFWQHQGHDGAHWQIGASTLRGGEVAQPRRRGIAQGHRIVVRAFVWMNQEFAVAPLVATTSPAQSTSS
jgi:hypothetical protein